MVGIIIIVCDMCPLLVFLAFLKSRLDIDKIVLMAILLYQFILKSYCYSQIKEFESEIVLIVN